MLSSITAWTSGLLPHLAAQLVDELLDGSGLRALEVAVLEDPAAVDLGAPEGGMRQRCAPRDANAAPPGPCPRWKVL